MDMMITGSIPPGMEISRTAILEAAGGDETLADLLWEGACNDGLPGWAIPLKWLVAKGSQPVEPHQPETTCATSISQKIIARAREWADERGWKTEGKGYGLALCGSRAALMDRSGSIVGEEAQVMCIATDGTVYWEAGPFQAYLD